MPPRFALRLAKEDFKFSVAHFTVFSESHAEHLHGHNYRVRVEIAGDSLDPLGLLMDLRPVKSEIRRLCAELDSKTLVPERCELVRVASTTDQVEVRFGARVYRFPRADVVLLPIRNTSIEEIAVWFWRELEPSVASAGADELRVEVEETAGQSCAYAAGLRERGKGDDAGSRGVR